MGYLPELDEVLRQEVERPELLPHCEREVRGLEAGAYRTPRRPRQHARSHGGAYAAAPKSFRKSFLL
jgi:hypothetical protein